MYVSISIRRKILDIASFFERHYRYNANQQLIAAHLGRGEAQQWCYDNALNLTSEGLIHSASAQGMGLYAEQKGGRVVKSWANSYRYDAFGRRTRKQNYTRSNKAGTVYAHSEKHIVGEEYLWNGDQLLEAAPPSTPPLPSNTPPAGPTPPAASHPWRNTKSSESR